MYHCISTNGNDWYTGLWSSEVVGENQHQYTFNVPFDMLGQTIFPANHLTGAKTNFMWQKCATQLNKHWSAKYWWCTVTREGWLVGVTALSAEKDYIVSCRNSSLLKSLVSFKKLKICCLGALIKMQESWIWLKTMNMVENQAESLYQNIIYVLCWITVTYTWLLPVNTDHRPLVSS